MLLNFVLLQCLLNEGTYCSHNTSVKFSIGGLDSRQGAKHAKFRREKINYLEKMFIIFRSLRPLRLCGRYSEFRLWRSQIKYQQRETLYYYACEFPSLAQISPAKWTPISFLPRKKAGKDEGGGSFVCA
jgi:hypothetical protein